MPAAANIINFSNLRRANEFNECFNKIEAVDVIAHLFPFVSEGQVDRAVCAEASSTGNPIDRDELVARHERSGFAFVPHAREAIDGEVAFGNTSLSFEWIKQHAEGWNMVGYDHNLIDPFQLLVYLVPK